MHDIFDCRIWSIVAGLALASAACGTRMAEQETGETGEPGCQTSADCPPGYSCAAGGVCWYNPPLEEEGETSSDHECTEHFDCVEELEICVDFHCTLLDDLPPACDAAGFAPPVPIEVPGQALALTFADVDADGQDELVVATETELLVYEPGGAAPTSSSREPGPIEDMVAGSFDATPGEDLLLLVADMLVLHGSNGDGSFAPGIVSPTAIASVNGLFAGELDDQPGTDLLAWGGAGAYIERGGEVVTFGYQAIVAGAAHEFDSSAPGAALRNDYGVILYSLDGVMVGGGWLGNDWPPVLAAFTDGLVDWYIKLTHHSTWSRVLGTNAMQQSVQWAIYGTPERLFTGDLDGNGTAELVLFDDGRVAIDHNPLGEGNCWHEPAMPTRASPSEAVFGDYDGDGDDEVAILTLLGEVVLIDGG